MADDQLTTDDEKLRGGIATKVLKYGSITLAIVAGIIIIAGVSLLIIAKGEPQGTEKAINLISNVFHSLLPVIATWVGTVIAFYFGKVNFEAASKSVQDLVNKITNSDDKLKATKVTDKGVMRLISEISYNKDIADKEDKNINVQKDLFDFIDTNKKGDRLPIFTSKNVTRYILHESTLNEFARKFTNQKYDALKDKKIEDITLDDLVNNTDTEMKSKLIKSAEFVSKNANLYEANDKLKANALCQDVFVTETGNETEEVIGWITNNKIAELAKL